MQNIRKLAPLGPAAGWGTHSWSLPPLAFTTAADMQMIISASVSSTPCHLLSIFPAWERRRWMWHFNSVWSNQSGVPRKVRLEGSRPGGRRLGLRSHSGGPTGWVGLAEKGVRARCITSGRRWRLLHFPAQLSLPKPAATISHPTAVPGPSGPSHGPEQCWQDVDALHHLCELHWSCSPGTMQPLRQALMLRQVAGCELRREPLSAGDKRARTCARRSHIDRGEQRGRRRGSATRRTWSTRTSSSSGTWC
jgi:hypothetical protein